MYSLVQLSLPRWQLSLRQAGVNTSYMLQPNMTALPHLLFFMADDTGWNNVGWHNPQMHTPNANKLVAEGLTLDRHYVLFAVSFKLHVRSATHPCAAAELGELRPRAGRPS